MPQINNLERIYFIFHLGGSVTIYCETCLKGKEGKQELGSRTLQSGRGSGLQQKWRRIRVIKVSQRPTKDMGKTLTLLILTRTKGCEKMQLFFVRKQITHSRMMSIIVMSLSRLYCNETCDMPA